VFPSLTKVNFSLYGQQPQRFGTLKAIL